MRIMVINKKKLGVTVIIIGLMIVLFALEKGFDEKLKFTSLIQNNINVLKKYEALNGTISYKLPEKWKVEEKIFLGADIIHHNEFESEDAKLHGFVEVWNLKEDLKSFLEKSKTISSKQNIIQNYSISNISMADRRGYLVNYNLVTDLGKTYKAYEYFVEDGPRFIRFSFFVREENFKENMPSIFNTIVKSININN